MDLIWYSSKATRKGWAAKLCFVWLLLCKAWPYDHLPYIWVILRKDFSQSSAWFHAFQKARVPWPDSSGGWHNTMAKLKVLGTDRLRQPLLSAGVEEKRCLASLRIKGAQMPWGWGRRYHTHPLLALQAAVFFLNYLYTFCFGQEFECLHGECLLFHLSLSFWLTWGLREDKKLAQEHRESNSVWLGWLLHFFFFQTVRWRGFRNTLDSFCLGFMITRWVILPPTDPVLRQEHHSEF